MPHNYFDDAINTGQPIVPPSANISPATNEVRNDQQPSNNEFKGLPVRAGGDKIFLLKNGKKFWITTKEVYENLGFKFGDEVTIDQVTLSIIPEGEPIRA